MRPASDVVSFCKEHCHYHDYQDITINQRTPHRHRASVAAQKQDTAAESAYGTQEAPGHVYRLAQQHIGAPRVLVFPHISQEYC